MLGEIVKNIRYAKGFTQKEVAELVDINQSTYSRFEADLIDIKSTTFFKILNINQLELGEFEFIKNGYKYSDEKRIVLNFISSIFKYSTNEFDFIIQECKNLLKSKHSPVVKEISIICESILFFEKKDYQRAYKLAIQVWDERLSKCNQFYIVDIILLSTIMFVFPLETAKGIRELCNKSIERYKGFQSIERLEINIQLNISLIYLRERLYSEAIKELDEIKEKCKYTKDYISLAICYVREGICLNNIGNVEGREWIKNGVKILKVLDEKSLLRKLETEITEFLL